MLYHFVRNGEKVCIHFKVNFNSYGYMVDKILSYTCTLLFRIEPHLVLKHILYINTPQNPFFKLVTCVNARDFTVFNLKQYLFSKRTHRFQKIFLSRVPINPQQAQKAKLEGGYSQTLLKIGLVNNNCFDIDKGLKIFFQA